MKFYEMGNGNLIAVGDRGTTIKAIRKLQDEEWARKQGGICDVREYTEEHAIYFAMHNPQQTLGEAIDQAERQKNIS